MHSDIRGIVYIYSRTNLVAGEFFKVCRYYFPCTTNENIGHKSSPSRVWKINMLVAHWHIAVEAATI